MIDRTSLRLPFDTRQISEYAGTIIEEMDGIMSSYGGWTWASPPANWKAFIKELGSNVKGAGVTF